MVDTVPSIKKCDFWDGFIIGFTKWSEKHGDLTNRNGDLAKENWELSNNNAELFLSI